MPSVDAIPEWMEIGDSGAGSTEDGTDGTRSRRFTVKYLLSNLNGYDAAEERLHRIAPLLRRGHRRGRCSADPVGGGFWVGTVDYANESVVVNPVGPVFSGWEWETSEKSERVTQAWTDSVAVAGVVPNANANTVVYTTLGATQPGINCPDFKGAIGVENDSIRGVEKPAALMNWSETWVYPATHITKNRPPRTIRDLDKKPVRLSQPPLFDTAQRMCFTVNKEPFRGRPSGSLLLTSVKTGRMNAGSSSVPVTFSLSYSPARTNFAVGPITVALKDGWDFLDVYYETNSSDREIVKLAKYVYVLRIFERTDFKDLGLPDDIPDWWLPDSMPGHQFNVPFGA